MWVQAAIDAGLTCVAVTDHNTGDWIDRIKDAAKDRLIVFPGVELTCSDAKVHLLILFDRDKGSQHIGDFLITSGIDREKFSEDTAHTNKNLEDIVELATAKGGLVIPAHIDEFNGLCEPANQIVERLLEQRSILGVQVVHGNFLVDDKKYKTGQPEFIKELNRYYRVSEEKIARKEFRFNEERMKKCRNAVTLSQKKNKAILTFSDNPHERQAPEHGLWGIGKRYTWIKMAESPSLESLRQALLMHGVRTRNDFQIESGDLPVQYPEVWFKSIKICGTELSDQINPELNINFSPQMNTIIGGRGSGKSSIFQFIRGLFDRGSDLEELDSIKSEFTNFFKLRDRKARKSGVLRVGCTIEVQMARKGTLYKIVFTQTNSDAKKISKELQRFDPVTESFVVDRAEEIPALFEFDLFSQKQIYEIALSPNSLRSRIDNGHETVRSAVQRLENLQQQYIEQSAAIRTLTSKVRDTTKREVEIRDLEVKLQRYRDSQLGELIKRYELLSKENSTIQNYILSLKSKSPDFDFLGHNISNIRLLTEGFLPESRTYFDGILELSNNKFSTIQDKLSALSMDFKQAIKYFEELAYDGPWVENYKDIEKRLNDVKSELGEIGARDVEIDIERLNKLKEEQARIDHIRETINNEYKAQEKIRKEFIAQRLELTKLRQDYLSELLIDGTVKVKVQQCGDTDTIEDQLRLIIGADIGFEKDFLALSERWNNNNPEKSNAGFRELFNRLINDEDRTEDFTRPFINKIKKLSGEDLDRLHLFFPEDDIRISYGKGGKSIPLSNASAGQKTAAILTILLAQGERPLLMDQPEDDLDTGLISDLIVNRLHEAKQQRQIIVVTHNPNIPVNGDSEYIIIMDAEKKHLSVKAAGCIETKVVKDEICRIMEGGMDAFSMRAERYKFS